MCTRKRHFTHTHRHEQRNTKIRCIPRRIGQSVLAVLPSQIARPALARAQCAHRACSSVKEATSSDELWEMVVIFSGVTYEMAKPVCWLPRLTLSHVSHFRGWKPQRGTETTSIKPPLILIHFVVSRELPLIKCVPDCIMGVSRGLLHEANSPPYSRTTLGWSGLKALIQTSQSRVPWCL